MPRKRGQIAGQALLYILAGLLFAGVLLFGIRAVSQLGERGSQVDLIQFKAGLANDIISLSRSYKDVVRKAYEFPSGFDEICFVDSDEVDADDIFGHPLIKDSVESDVEANVFLLGDTFEAFYVKELALPAYPYYSCFDADVGKVEIRLEGRGDETLVQAPPSGTYCQNAQDGGLCEGLDIVFYSGYKKSCCDRYKVCCS